MKVKEMIRRLSIANDMNINVTLCDPTKDGSSNVLFVILKSHYDYDKDSNIISEGHDIFIETNDTVDLETQIEERYRSADDWDETFEDIYYDFELHGLTPQDITLYHSEEEGDRYQEYLKTREEKSFDAYDIVDIIRNLCRGDITLMEKVVDIIKEGNNDYKKSIESDC